MTHSHSLRKLSAISDQEKTQLFYYLFVRRKDRNDMLCSLRNRVHQSEQEIIISAFPELQNWLFRESGNESTWSGAALMKWAHYVRACYWLRQHGFEIPVGVKETAK